MVIKCGKPWFARFPPAISEMRGTPDRVPFEDNTFPAKSVARQKSKGGAAWVVLRENREAAQFRSAAQRGAEVLRAASCSFDYHYAS